jgi:hypothetical protein
MAPDMALWATLSLGTAIGNASAITAAALKSLRLIIIGSIYGTLFNPLGGRSFPSTAPIARRVETVGRELYAE